MDAGQIELPLLEIQFVTGTGAGRLTPIWATGQVCP